MPEKHRRAQIIDALASLFEQLKAPTTESGFPIQIKTVQRRYVNWTQLDKQNAIPALLLTYGDSGNIEEGGSSAPYGAVGQLVEHLPFALTCVLKDNNETPLTDQTADLHYSIGRLINGTRRLGVDGVADTRIVSWRGSEGAVTKFELIKFRIVVDHIYRATQSV